MVEGRCGKEMLFSREEEEGGRGGGHYSHSQHRHGMQVVTKLCLRVYFLLPAPYTAPGMAALACRAAMSSSGSPVPVTSFPTETQ